jgi:hypothetical protein
MILIVASSGHEELTNEKLAKGSLKNYHQTRRKLATIVVECRETKREKEEQTSTRKTCNQ